MQMFDIAPNKSRKRQRAKLDRTGIASLLRAGGELFRHQPIFYPASPDTNRPMGKIVYRVAPQSDWKLLPESEPSSSTPAQLNGHVAWIEMPPGGWADGEYEDPGSPAGDHAYELEVKVATDEKASRLISRAYVVNSN